MYMYILLNIAISIFVGFLSSLLFYIVQKEHSVKNNHLFGFIRVCKKTKTINQDQQIQYKLNNSKCLVHKLCNQSILAEERLATLTHVRQECKKLHVELQNQLIINHSQSTKIKEMTIRLEENKLFINNHHHKVINNEHYLSEHFENLAHKILEKNIEHAERYHHQNLTQLLSPLKEQLEYFSKQIHNHSSQQTREYHELTYEIKNLQKLNAHITQETINLTRALKGNNKIQGNWGEFILNNILESSGLREGYEFRTHVNLKQENGEHRQPDVVVQLPQGKDIIIDAKISLLAYEKYFNTHNNDQATRQLALNEHIHSLRLHMKSLSKKNYQKLLGIKTLDYILMFIPIEPAFILAIDKQPELLNEALSCNIMLVSPTTLLVALRTIKNLWYDEYQNKNAQLIADQATILYDKLRLFIENMNSIGHHLDKVQISYNLARKKLYEGRGNILDKAELFRNLGVYVKEPIVSTTKIL